ncbi:MAG: ZIP family metal transporter [archaeon]|jgi:zinc and cadmium transporter|nr:ZIP family metal transporter [archaeon]MDD2477410.1 ZIP family metal transporter [Candidatus ainarchaeum sp.]MDD3084477.1 ZIP family metal transporter [Candidatus ainarchaeum sp.]MDD4220941.1 ZIP family metal transporter [Candidatus ainarchaeum sp.]MDD4662257.1 ZIP family metal transporter [Candidatus ainarchaeum sp.]
MLSVWLYSIISVLIVSLISLIGIITLFFKIKKMNNILLFAISFSAGALIGDAILHILPELVKDGGFTLSLSLFFIFGLIIFFILEKFIHWRHCHVPTSKKHPHPFAYMNLVGDALHNFIDGLVIGGTYLVSIPIGIATTIAVILHEIPQEIGDFGVLIHGGFTIKKALVMNFLTALTSIVGVVIALLLGQVSSTFLNIILAITAGGFIYIATADLIPELKKETNIYKSLIQLLGIFLGIGVMLILLLLLG